MPRRLRQTHCYVPKCKTGTKYGSKASLFSVPKDDDKRRIWQERLGCADKPLTASCAVCERHFEPHFIVKDFVHIVNGVEVRIPRDRKFLTPDALPRVASNVPTAVDPPARKSKSKRIPFENVHAKRRCSARLQGKTPPRRQPTAPKKKARASKAVNSRARITVTPVAPNGVSGETNSPKKVDGPIGRVIEEPTSKTNESNCPDDRTSNCSTSPAVKNSVPALESSSTPTCEASTTAGDVNDDDRPITSLAQLHGIKPPSLRWAQLQFPNFGGIAYAGCSFDASTGEISVQKSARFSYNGEGNLWCKLYLRNELVEDIPIATMKDAKEALLRATALCCGAADSRTVSTYNLTKGLQSRISVVDGAYFSIDCLGNSPKDGAPCLQCKRLREALLVRKCCLERERKKEMSDIEAEIPNFTICEVACTKDGQVEFNYL